MCAPQPPRSGGGQTGLAVSGTGGGDVTVTSEPAIVDSTVRAASGVYTAADF
ncbi:hypothetical protein [Paractinoplanes rishiriensis]|uniref:Uncharacterized protein n=1 Tax=Paractinoplanes rishiriensis TaxID=1050105 RepID=A0A919K7T4_9ACTN|nr:hypothetical protein [Actinoplanes rishiriensis]GIF01265.1 hypothetical protein Ari01nite_87290 [Actinoplanes rishiriensis]